MNSRFGLSEEDLATIFSLMQQFHMHGKIFGSRVRGTEKAFSEAFEASTLPIVVDISRYEDLNTVFRELLDREGILIPNSAATGLGQP